jgi:hypothetical protein
MNTQEFLTNLTQQGIELLVNDDKLSIRSPKGVLTPKLCAELIDRKKELLAFLHSMKTSMNSSASSLENALSLETIGYLIGGFIEQSIVECKQPLIDPRVMAQKLTVTFRPLPDGYKNMEVLKFREDLKMKLQTYGVNIKPWERATTDFQFELKIPIIKWKRIIKTRIVRSDVNAVIDVERAFSLKTKIGIFVAERVYQIYTQLIARGRKMSISRIAILTSWAEDHVAQRIENPTNTQVIILKPIDYKFVNSQLPYQKKIQIGLNTLVRTYSEIVIGVSREKISLLNMNLCDSLFSKKELDNFVLHSLIPKIFVPIAPLLLNRFELEKYDPHQSDYAKKLVTLGKELADTGLFPQGSKLSEVIPRKSQREIVSLMMDGRTGVSYGFVAYAEAPKYVGNPEITEDEWKNLCPVPGLNFDEIRQNDIGRWYVKIYLGVEYKFKQIPDIWLVSSRSGSNKTNLNLEYDVIRIGLKGKLFLQLPQGVDSTLDIKPSYDVYVMISIALSTALYTPELIKNGMPIVHFHGYPAFEWFKPNEYYTGVNNPSVPCGTYESGVFNFLGIQKLASQYDENIALACLIEPDHGTNVIAPDLDYLIARLKAGCEDGQIELGGRYFASLKLKKTIDINSVKEEKSAHDINHIAH